MASYENSTTTKTRKRQRSSSHVNVENALFGFLSRNEIKTLVYIKSSAPIHRSWFVFFVQYKFVIKYNELRYINIANYGYNEVFTGVPRNDHPFMNIKHLKYASCLRFTHTSGIKTGQSQR